MRRRLLIPLALAALAGGLPPSRGSETPRGLLINEVSALGMGHDWVELYNATGETIDGLPLSLRDTLDGSGNRFPLCVSSLRPGERRLVTCPNFLNGNGEELALVDQDGNILDSLVYGRQTFNLSFGRREDGAAEWCFQYPSERTANGTVPEDWPPVVLGAPYHWPLRPAADEPVSISIAAVAPAGLDAVEVLANPEEPGGGSSWISLPCLDDGLAPDEAAGDGRFTARIPGFPAGTAVRYRVRAADRKGKEVFAPSADGSFAFRWGYAPPPVRINEVLASNRSVGRYRSGEEYFLSDWIELYNAGDTVVDLSRWSLSDRRTAGIPNPIIGKGRKFITPGGHLLVWARRYFPEEIPDAVGVNFSLSRNGEEIVLFAEDGFSVVDAVRYPELEKDQSYGRVPEGTGEFAVMDTPTPQGGIVYPPRRLEVLSYSPLLPELGEEVLVKARISPAVSVETAEVYLWLLEEARVPLRDDGLDGDDVAGDGVYAARIGPFRDSGVLHFALELTSREGTGYRDPENAKEWYRIPLSWRPPGPLKINEVFAASHLCCPGCLAFRSLSGPLELLNFVEIRNSGDVGQDLKQLYLTDDPLDPMKYPLEPPPAPAGGGSLAPAACRVIWFPAGDETEVLDRGGGMLFLTDGTNTIDAVTYGEAVPGKSYGYLPQEGSTWTLGEPSPGFPNGSPFFVRGDGNGDLRLNLTDAVLALRVLFWSTPVDCPDALDSDDSGRLTIADPLVVLEYLFRGGPAPALPFPDSGADPSADDLGCRG